MPDAVELVKTIKRAAAEVQTAAKPVELCYGKVVSAAPLKILVEQKLMLGQAQLVLARNVTDYQTEITVDWLTEENEEASADAHKHAVQGKKKIIIQNGLVAGDDVILCRQQGGQKYLVADRIG